MRQIEYYVPEDASPEYEDCARVAASGGVALKAVYDAARMAAKVNSG